VGDRGPRPGIAVALAAVLTAALAACQTLSDVQPGQGHSFTISGRPYDEVWAASLKVAEQHLVVQEQSKTEGVILGERTGTGGGWFGVYLTGAGANAYRVEVVRKGKYVGQIAWANWEARMVRDIQTALGIAPAR
jgi:hypothetical protein